jgi:hypothetical protein
VLLDVLPRAPRLGLRRLQRLPRAEQRLPVVLQQRLRRLQLQVGRLDGRCRALHALQQRLEGCSHGDGAAGAHQAGDLLPNGQAHACCRGGQAQVQLQMGGVEGHCQLWACCRSAACAAAAEDQTRCATCTSAVPPAPAAPSAHLHLAGVSRERQPLTPELQLQRRAAQRRHLLRVPRRAAQPQRAPVAQALQQPQS